MNNNPIVKFVVAAFAGLILIVVLAVIFIRLADPTRETVNTAPPENEVRQPRAPEPATSTAPGAPRNGTPPPAPGATPAQDPGSTSSTARDPTETRQAPEQSDTGNPP